MARVAFVIDRTFDDREFQTAFDRVRQAGHEVVLVGPRAGESIHGSHGHVHVSTDRSVDDLSVNDVDAALVPGGFPRNHLRTHERVLNFIRDVFAQGKPVAAMHSPGFAMVRAEHQGNLLASWPVVKRELLVERKAEADEFDRDVLIVSHDADPDAFCDAFLAQLERGPRGAPEPIFNEKIESDEVAKAYGPEPAPPES